MSSLIKRYVEAYSSGDVNTNNHTDCASYLEGFVDAAPEMSDEAKSRFARCISMLRGSANFVEYVRSHTSNTGVDGG